MKVGFEYVCMGIGKEIFPLGSTAVGIPRFRQDPMTWDITFSVITPFVIVFQDHQVGFDFME